MLVKERCVDLLKEKEIDEKDILSEKKFSIDKELAAIESSLRESRDDILKLMTICREFRKSLQKMTKDQLFEWDRFLKDYEFFEEDVDVNGERVKNITKALIQRARQIKVSKEQLEECDILPALKCGASREVA